jgi:small-conductance mechanosensitive channel
MARTVASITDIYGPSASLLFPQTQAANPPIGGSTNTQLGANVASSGGVPVTQVLQNLQGSVLGQPIAWLFAVVLFLVAWKLIEEHRGGQEAFTKIRVDGTNIIKVGFMAVIFLIVVRYFAARYTVPGLSDLVIGGT